MSMLCGNCSDPSALVKLRVGETYLLKCPKCCKHTKGTWTLTDAYAGYRWGFKTDVCADGCGAILREEQLLG